MPSLKAIRKRIASVKNTQKITRAMKLVSAAKLRRAQQAMLELRLYAAKQRELLASLARQLAEAGETEVHPLLTPREVRTVGVVALSSDRGMCGSFNAGGIRRTGEVVRERLAGGQNVVFFSLGRRMGIAARKLKLEKTEDLGEILPAATPSRVQEIAARLVGAFVDGEVDEVVFVSCRFKNALVQLPTVLSLLPITPPTADATPGAGTDAFYEPTREALLGYMAPRFAEVQVRQAIFESIAGEHAARMNAMSSATDNAMGMIQRLTLEMNRARQAAITKELMEVIGGAEAMK